MVCPVNTPRKRDTLGAVLAVASGIAGLASILWVPFLLGPLAVIVVLAAALMSQSYTKLIGLATAVVGIGFLIGAGLAVAGSHPLY